MWVLQVLILISQDILPYETLLRQYSSPNN